MNIGSDRPVALVTGAAHRIGAVVARHLHTAGYNVIIHYRQSRDAALALVASLNNQVANSAQSIAADLNETAQLPNLIAHAQTCWERLDLLVNNASSFYPTPLGNITEHAWDDLVGSNLKAPLFLSQAAAPYLQLHHGSIVNMADIHTERPLAQHAVYLAAKAGLVGLTRALARDLAPHVRANAIAPGAILWPEDMPADTQQRILDAIPLQRPGTPEDIAKTVLFLAQSPYITGQIIAVDGGRSIKSS